MAKKLYDNFKKLKLFYVFVFAMSALLIAPTHIFPEPYFMYARFPHYLQTMDPFFEISWPVTFEIYHYVLYVLGITISFNALGILIYPKLKKIAAFTSGLAITLFSLIILFFFIQFINVHVSTAIIFGFYSVVWLILSILTFKVLTKQKEE